MPGPGRPADGPDRRFGAGAATREEDAIPTAHAGVPESAKVREGATDH